MDFQELQTDIEAAEDGISFPFGEDCSIKIAQWGNKKHKKFMRKIHQRYGRQFDVGGISDDQADDIMAGQWEFIIRDWEGFTEGGKPVKCTPEVLKKLSTDKRYNDFFKKIEAISKEEENFRLQNIKEVGEGLPTT